MKSVRPALSVAFLRALVERRRVQMQGGQPAPVTLTQLLQLHGDASLVVVLLVVSILTVAPLAGVGSVLSFAIFAIAWRWVAGVQGRTDLPFAKTLNNIALSPAWSDRTLRLFASVYARADRWFHPRWNGVFLDVWAPWWAAWIALMAAVIFLPLPFGNILPSLSLVLLCLAWMFRDGVLCLCSVLVGTAALAYTAAFGQWLWALGLQLQEQVRRWLAI